jgi:hypothetical protein
MQQFLKSARRAAWTQVVAAELLVELFVDVNDAVAALHVRFGREPAAALTRALESRRRRRRVADRWVS